MSQEKRITEEDVDGLVRAYLSRIEQTVDTPRMIEGVVADVKGTAERLPSGGAPVPSGASHPSRRRWRRWSWGVAAAAAILLTSLLILQLGTAQASPEALVREAREAHALSVDRCYLVQATLLPEIDEDYPLLEPKPKVLVWTRGDQYWMQPADSAKQWRSGRDEHGRFWLVLGPRLGLRFDPEEAPRWRTLGGDVCSLQLETLLQETLTDFDVRWEQPRPQAAAGTRVVRADLKPGHTHPTLRNVTLEIDPETKVVRRAVLTRLFLRPEPFTAAVTATLIDTGPQSESQYRLEGHLGLKARILTSTEPEQRRAVMDRLRQHLGGRP